ncbi:MAG: hypothetical protein ABI461_07575 [Polyangiaceae bacterium]
MVRLGFKIAAFGMVVFAAQSASAQTVGGSASVGGNTSANTTPPAPPPPPPDNPPATVTATSAASTSASAPGPAVASAKEAEDSNTPDHENVIGHFAVGYMGISQLPIAGAAAGGGGGLGQNTITAPVIGVRYWLNRMIGIDGGIGFGLASGGQSINNGTTTTDTDAPSSLGFALHAGVPLAMAHGKHYSFELIPEGNVGFTTGTIKAAAPGGTDTDLSGFRVDLGGRVGAEIYFGFIGVPQLSLQASVGAYFSHLSWKASQGNASASITQTTLGTSVQGAPWAIFVNNISALYYF